MGTSHEEPMMRSIPVEWNLFGDGTLWDYSVNADFIYQFWVNGTERAKLYENLYTVGMRGNGDGAFLCGSRLVACGADDNGRPTRALLDTTEPLTGGQNIQLLEKVVSDQRQILMNVYNVTDVTTIPQMWCLCMSFADSVIGETIEDGLMTDASCFTDKEVQGYYEQGMTVPDDITLLWTDDKYAV